MATLLEQIETEIAHQYERMIGSPPVGLTDILRILTHPDLIDKTEEYVRVKRIEDFRALKDKIG